MNNEYLQNEWTVQDRRDQEDRAYLKRWFRGECEAENTPIFDELAAEIHPVNKEKGFWGPPEMMDKYVAKLALIHSEVTEVLEALRKSQGADKVTEEFADIIIRLLDLFYVLKEAGLADSNLYQVVLDKMEKNRNRPSKHGHIWG